MRIAPLVLVPLAVLAFIAIAASLSVPKESVPEEHHTSVVLDARSGVIRVEDLENNVVCYKIEHGLSCLPKPAKEPK